ncbi:MAG: formate dehydrogenase subunit gamma [Pseudomonadota bacterium]
MPRPILSLAALILSVALATTYASAQTSDAPVPDRSATGGAQTLDDIMARQQGLQVDNSFRSDNTGDPDSAAGMAEQLGTLGGASDPEMWRALRFGTANVTASNNSHAATVLIQDGGMKWMEFRNGPLKTYGAYLLLGTIALLILFFIIRGRIPVDYEPTGRTVVRFKSIERFGHWLLAISFIVLGITGLITLFGRKFIIPWLGHDAFAPIAIASKFVHNNVAWAFMLALVMIFVMWVVHNLPSRTDLVWIAKGGGIFTKDHPPAKKFNAGQKVIFWSCIILGGSISASGLSLLFPFEMAMFAPTFEKLNAVGLPQLLGFGELRTTLAPHEEMQYAAAWHAIVSFVLMAIIIAHIYIGSVGMEGAYDAMGTGEVREEWAVQHHSIWAEEVKAERDGAPQDATPAE